MYRQCRAPRLHVTHWPPFLSPDCTISHRFQSPRLELCHFFSPTPPIDLCDICKLIRCPFLPGSSYRPYSTGRKAPGEDPWQHCPGGLCRGDAVCWAELLAVRCPRHPVHYGGILPDDCPQLGHPPRDPDHRHPSCLLHCLFLRPRLCRRDDRAGAGRGHGPAADIPPTPSCFTLLLRPSLFLCLCSPHAFEGADGTPQGPNRPLPLALYRWL